MGQNWGVCVCVCVCGGGGLPGQPQIALIPLGPWLLLSFLPPVLMLNLRIYLVAGANGSSGGSHHYFCCFNDISWIMSESQQVTDV